MDVLVETAINFESANRLLGRANGKRRCILIREAAIINTSLSDATIYLL